MEDLLVNKIGRASKLLFRHFAQQLDKYTVDLTIQEYIFLLRLDKMNSDEITQKAMASKLGKDKSVILRQIKGLEEKKFVARLSSTTDKRESNVVLTTYGKAVLDKAMEIERSISSELMEHLESKDLAKLFDSVSRYIIEKN